MLPTPEKETASKKRKTKSSFHFTADQKLEETRNKKCIFPTTIKRTTSGQSNLMGTRAEGRFIVIKNQQQMVTSGSLSS
jgi:hypothetical protein